MTLQLQKFDPTTIPFRNDINGFGAPIIAIIGTGSKWLIRDLLYHFQDIPICTVISGNGGFSGMVPKMFIHEQYKPEIIHNVIMHQRKLTEKRIREIREFKQSDTDIRDIVVLDDCLVDLKSDKLLRCLFLNGRSWRVMLLISMDRPLAISPLMTAQIDYTFILRDTAESNRRLIYENYASIFPSFEDFCSVMDKTTEYYECMVIHNKNSLNRLADCINWYKPSGHPNFRLCKPEYWELSEVVSDDSEPEETLM